VIGGVVEEATRKGKVLGSNPTGHETRNFTQKKACDFDGCGRLANGPSL